MFGHDHQSDEREVILGSHFYQNLDEEVSRADGAEKREAAVTTAGDEVEVALTVAAFESSGHDEKFKSSRNGNVKGNPAFAKTAKTGAPANSRANSNTMKKSKTKAKAKPQARQNNRRMNHPSGIIGGGARSIVESMDAKGLIG
jgi:hypothetical protein